MFQTTRILFRSALLLTGLALTLASNPALAAALFDGSYSQDFDSLANAPLNCFTACPWANDSTIQGWYMINQVNLNNYTVDDGTGSFQAVAYSMGTIGNTDRAFMASVNGSGLPLPAIGVELTNNTGGNITSIDVGWTAEQWWRLSTGGIHFSYSLNATSLSSGTYTADSALDGFTVQPASGGRIALDGNNAANRTIIFGTVALASPWGAGSDLWLKWTGDIATNSSLGLGVDDVMVTTSAPEPSSIALLAMAGIGLVLGRRRTR